MCTEELAERSTSNWVYSDRFLLPTTFKKVLQDATYLTKVLGLIPEW
jgi:hypothetical protein